jgi:hypothetical protein
MVRKLDAVLSDLEAYRAQFSNYSSFIALINNTTASLNIKEVYLSKNYIVKTISIMENKIPTTKLEKQVNAISIFVLTTTNLFEFQLLPELVRYDVVLLKSVQRMELIINGEITSLLLNHNLSTFSILTLMHAYTESEREALFKIKDFIFARSLGN